MDMDYEHLKKYIFGALKEMKDYFWYKFAGALMASYAFAFGGMRVEIIQAIIFLVAADFLTGVSASKIIGLEIKSSLAFRTPFKFFVYILMIICSHQVGVLIPYVEEWLIGGMSGFLGVNEFLSIMENIGNMGFRTPQKLLNKLEEIKK